MNKKYRALFAINNNLEIIDMLDYSSCSDGEWDSAKEEYDGRKWASNAGYWYFAEVEDGE